MFSTIFLTCWRETQPHKHCLCHFQTYGRPYSRLALNQRTTSVTQIGNSCWCFVDWSTDVLLTVVDVWCSCRPRWPTTVLMSAYRPFCCRDGIRTEPEPNLTVRLNEPNRTRSLHSGFDSHSEHDRRDWRWSRRWVTCRSVLWWTDLYQGLGLLRVLEYSSTTRVVNYSSNFLLLEYSLISISGCKFPFLVAVFLQSVDKLMEFKQFMQTWGFAISFAIGQLGNRSEYIHVEGCYFFRSSLRALLYAAFGAPGMLIRQSTTPSSSLAACIKVLPVLTSTRVLVKVLRWVLE